MVVTCLPATSESGVLHERVISPLTWTVQAPHCATPQPNLVPVILRCSRITHSSGVSGSAFTSTLRPLIVNAVIGAFLPPLRSCFPAARAARFVLSETRQLYHPADKMSRALGSNCHGREQHRRRLIP